MKSCSTRYRHLVLALLWAAALFRFVDLQILAVLLESIKAEFTLSDTELALLGGAAFGIFYGLLGIPVAWLAEHCSRRTVIAVAVTLWSLMTLLCGKATTFTSLLLARMGVGIGEAGAYPPSTSLLADYFPEAQRHRAFALLASAIPIGVLVGFAAGSFLNIHLGWRVTLQILGIPGILLGLMIMLLLREPERHSQAAPFNWTAFKRDSLALWKLPAYRTLVAASSLFTMGAVGSGLWFPAFYLRHHLMAPESLGLLMAGLYGLGGLCGSLLGGYLCNKRQGPPLVQLASVCSRSLWLSLPLAALVLLAKPLPLVILSHLGLAVLMHVNLGPVLHALQQLASTHQRVLAHAYLLMVTNVIGLPLGPLFVGWVSDQGSKEGSEALGTGILLLLLGCWSVSAWLFGRLSPRVMSGQYREESPLPPTMPESAKP